MDDVFEQRWRKAYEVRALERESRSGAGKSQVRALSSRFASVQAACMLGGWEHVCSFLALSVGMEGTKVPPKHIKDPSHSACLVMPRAGRQRERRR